MSVVDSSHAAKTLLRRGAQHRNPPEKIFNNYPEHAGNHDLKTYTVVHPVPPVVPLAGTYCKGLACRFRDGTPSFGGLNPMAAFWAARITMPYFCRGLGCPIGAGLPPPPAATGFAAKCSFFLGADRKSKADAAAKNFEQTCQNTLNINETWHCQDYADVMRGAGALDPLDLCTATFKFLNLGKQAQVDLQLVSAALGGPSMTEADLSLSCEDKIQNISGSVEPAVNMTFPGISPMELVRFVKTWCAEQSSAGLQGHPEWDSARCAGMETIVSYALREELAAPVNTAPVNKSVACNRLMLVQGSMNRIELLMKGGWTMAPLGSWPGTPPPDLYKAYAFDDPEITTLLTTSRAAHMAAVSGLLNAQKAVAAAATEKATVTNVMSGGVAETTPDAGPDTSLPDSSTFDFAGTGVLSAVRLKKLKSVDGSVK